MSEPTTTTEPAAEVRVSIEHSGDGTTATFDRDDLDARAAVKAAGFRWSRAQGLWFLPRPWAYPTRTLRVRRVVAALPDGDVTVVDAGPEATGTAAEREAERIERAGARAERLTGRAEALHAESDRRAETAHALGSVIPFGQPVLVGHHSERGHRRLLDRIETNGRKSVEAYREAEETERRARAAARTAAGPTPLARLRRIDRAEAELRRARRILADSDRLEALPDAERAEVADRLGRHPISAGYRARVEAAVARLVDEIGHDRAQVQAAGQRVYGPADVAKGDEVRYRGEWRRVVRVNRTTVSVATGYSWTDRVELHQVTGVRRPAGAPPAGVSVP